ncbi:MAG: hypothetical protein ACOYOA_10035 [Saprospiraceae bacterium]
MSPSEGHFPLCRISLFCQFHLVLNSAITPMQGLIIFIALRWAAPIAVVFRPFRACNTTLSLLLHTILPKNHRDGSALQQHCKIQFSLLHIWDDPHKIASSFMSLSSE